MSSLSRAACTASVFAVSLLWSLSLQGCTTDEGAAEAGGVTTDETSTGDGDGDASTGDGDGDTATGDGDGDDAPPTPNACGCTSDEVCVGIAGVCAFGSGFSIVCVDVAECDGPCTCEAICGEACVPACEGGDGVNFWCDGLADFDDCNILEQDCDEGEKCVPENYFGDNTCIPITGDAALGEPCSHNASSGADDCDGQGFCFEPANGEGACQPFCTPEAGCEDPEQGCAIYNQGVIAMCLDTCTPLDEAACPDGGLCVRNTEGEEPFVCLPGAGNLLAQGEPCSYVNDCEPGLICQSSEFLDGCEGDACCTTFCELDDPQACVGLKPMMCISYFDPAPAPAGLEQLGVCALPP